MTLSAPRTDRMVETVLGPVPAALLGRTLVHEHLQLGVPGWQLDTLTKGSSFRERVKLCVDKIEELKSAGYSTIVDPCPSDMGRDAELLREVAALTQFNIVCAAGFFTHDIGQSSHWVLRMMLDQDTDKRVRDVLVKDIVEGIGESGIKAGILKVASGTQVTEFERMMLRATAMASLETGIPVTTHTDAVHGDTQLDVMAGAGLDPAQVIVGHSCGSNDIDYLQLLARKGAFVGFDRFGYEDINLDEHRVENLALLARAGFLENVVISHDCVLCYRGLEDLRPLRGDGMLHIEHQIIPQLRARGLDDAAIDQLLVHNPARFFGHRPHD